MAAATLDKAETGSQKRTRERAEFKADREYAKAQNAATSYGANLRAFARQIERIIHYYATGVPLIVPPERMPALNDALRRYALGIQPWARAAAAKMVAEVDRRNRTAWEKHTREMSWQLRQELARAPTGEAVHGLMEQQVELITSLPLDAAEHVHSLSMEGLVQGSRYAERTAEVEQALAAAHPDATGAWLRTRATLIARTETARAASVLTQARSDHIGATHYTWLTAADDRVRPSHRRLNKKVFAWADPPLSDPPAHYSHPGQIFNCRCVAIPIITDD